MEVRGPEWETRGMSREVSREVRERRPPEREARALRGPEWETRAPVWDVRALRLVESPLPPCKSSASS